jgi:hypothetical protein
MAPIFRGVGWNHNGSMIANEPFGSAQMQPMGMFTGLPEIQPWTDIQQGWAWWGFLIVTNSKIFFVRIRALKIISFLILLNTRILLNYLPEVCFTVLSQFRSKGWVSSHWSGRLMGGSWMPNPHILIQATTASSILRRDICIELVPGTCTLCSS